MITRSTLVLFTHKLINGHRATEMDITILGLQNAGKTSLVRVLAVRYRNAHSSRKSHVLQGGEFTIE